MAIVVSLRELDEKLQMVSQDSQVYLNKVTGEFVLVTSDILSTLRRSGDDFDGVPEWEVEVIREIKRITEFEEVYEQLPSSFEIHEYAMMERFSLSFPDEAVSEALLYNIRGSGAFRRFKDTIYRYGIEKAWFEYREEAYKEVAIAWLERHGIAYVDDVNRRESSA